MDDHDVQAQFELAVAERESGEAIRYLPTKASSEVARAEVIDGV